jgi:glutathione S-transferase
MIKLYDFKSSPNCQRVRVVLAEKNLPYETVPIDLRAQAQKTPDYLKLNPYGKVPVLTDDDTVLYESCIINEYLDEKYPAAHARRSGKKSQGAHSHRLWVDPLGRAVSKTAHGDDEG